MFPILIGVVVLVGLVGSYVLGMSAGISETVQRLEAGGMDGAHMHQILDESCED